MQLHCPSNLCVRGEQTRAECAEFLLLLFDYLIWFGAERSKESSVSPSTTKSGSYLLHPAVGLSRAPDFSACL